MGPRIDWSENRDCGLDYSFPTLRTTRAPQPMVLAAGESHEQLPGVQAIAPTCADAWLAHFRVYDTPAPPRGQDSTT